MRGRRLLQTGVAFVVLASAALSSPAAHAQTAGDLAAARKLFAEAVADENGRRYEGALDKFRRVAAVKDTANVRYRIASCLDALGRRAEALVSYEAVVRLGESDPSAADAVRAAAAQAAELDRVVPRLSIVIPANAPPGTDVRVDDAPADVRQPIVLDPGHHTITATAPGDIPFRTGVTLSEGGRVSINVTLEPLPIAAPPPSGPATVIPTSTSTSTSTAPPRSHDVPTGAWVAIGVGGALVVGSVVSFILRSSNLSTLSSDCQTAPDGRLSCPQSRRNQDSGAQSAAQIEGPLGIGLAAGGAVALGIGIWLVASAPTSAPTTTSRGLIVSPALSPRSGMLVLSGPLDSLVW